MEHGDEQHIDGFYAEGEGAGPVDGRIGKRERVVDGASDDEQS